MGTLGNTRANPVVVEIPVNATGTRPGSGPDKRELFSEETATVLVFPDGAVIRLSAAVATGQLIFLTNTKTKVEVVSQVVGKRVHRPTSCYVELKFTEEIAGFWGVEFPENAAEAVHTSEQGSNHEQKESAEKKSVTEAVSSAEPIDDRGSAVTELPTDKEVDQLRDEVETLRRQLNNMKKAEDAAKTVASMAEAVRATVPLTLPGAAPPPLVNDAPANTMAVAEQVKAAKAPHVPMKLPIPVKARIDPEQEVIDQLLPRPELDFSKAPDPSLRRDPNDPFAIYKPTRVRVGKSTVALLAVAVVLVVALGAWKFGILGSLFGGARKSSAATEFVKPVSAVTVPVTPSNANAPSGSAGHGTSTSTSSAPPVVAPPAANAAVPDDLASRELSKADVGSVNEGNGKANNWTIPAEPSNKEVERKSAGGREVLKHGTFVARKKTADESAVAASAKPAEVQPAGDDEPVVPAKLLKEASPVYPPWAMRNFITGDVRMTAEVDEKGRVRNMEVVSGPKALRAAAIEAMKQYQYAPATKNGKGVASQVRVTIKFWFIP